LTKKKRADTESMSFKINGGGMCALGLCSGAKAQAKTAKVQVKKDDKNLPHLLVVVLVTDNSLAKRVGTPTGGHPVAEVRCVGSYVSVWRISNWLGVVVSTGR
jgi:hypothetical protein